MTNPYRRSILLSYAAPEGRLSADIIYAYLRQHGPLQGERNRWLDLEEVDRDEYGLRLRELFIVDGDIVLCLISPKWLSGGYARQELDAARRRGARLLPVIVDARIDNSHLPNWLRTEQPNIWLQSAQPLTVDLNQQGAKLLENVQGIARCIERALSQPITAAPKTNEKARMFAIEFADALDSVARERHGLQHLWQSALQNLQRSDHPDVLPLLNADNIKYTGVSMPLGFETIRLNDIHTSAVITLGRKEEALRAKIVHTADKPRSSTNNEAAALAAELLTRCLDVERALKSAALCAPNLRQEIAGSETFRDVQQVFASAAAALKVIALSTGARVDADDHGSVDPQLSSALRRRVGAAKGGRPELYTELDLEEILSGKRIVSEAELRAAKEAKRSRERRSELSLSKGGRPRRPDEDLQAAAALSLSAEEKKARRRAKDVLRKRASRALTGNNQ